MRNHRATIAFLVFLALAGAALPVVAERLSIRTYSSVDGLASGFVDNIYRDSHGFMWFCTRNGLSRFDGSRFVNYQLDDGDTTTGIESIFETRDGDYFVSTTSGTFWFRGDAIGAGGPTKLSAKMVTPFRGSFLQDAAGNVWMASTELYRIEMQAGTPDFVKVDWNIPAKENTNRVTYGITQTADLSLWLFTSWGLARRMPDGRMVVYQIDRRLYDGNGTIAMESDSVGQVWISIGDNLLVINPEPIGSLPADEWLSLRSLEASHQIDLVPGTRIIFPPAGRILRLKVENDLSIRRMYSDSRRDIWLTASGRLYQISDAIPKLYTSEQGLPESMSRISEDAAGNIWIGGHISLIRLDRSGLTTFNQLDGARSARFAAITEDSSGNLRFASSFADFVWFAGSRLESAQLHDESTIEHIWTSRFMMIDSSDRLWFLTTGGLYRYDSIRDPQKLDHGRPSRVYTTDDGLKSIGFFQIYEDSKGAVWVSTRGPSNAEHGLARLDPGSDRFHTFSEAEGFPSLKSASSFAEDRAGNLWISFYEGGLARFDGRSFRIFEPGGVIPKALISDLHIDLKGRLWIASTVRGLVRVDDPTAAEPAFTAISAAEGLTSNNVRTITEDNFGRIYLGTASGVDCLTPETGHVRHYSVNDGLAADFVVDSRRDRNGDVWFATNNGISRLTPRESLPRTAPPVFIGSLRIAGVEQPVSILGTREVGRGDLEDSENNLQIDYFSVDFQAGETIRYQYRLDGADQEWSQPTDQRSVALANLSPGSYRFLVRAINSDGVVSEEPAGVSFRILRPIWMRWWFIVLAAVTIALLFGAFYGYRMARLREVNAALEEARRADEDLRRSREERIAELEQVRSRIATDLHDDIGASLTQIAILSEVAQAQSRNGTSAPLRMITAVSNELVGTMSDIVWSINPQKDHFSDLTQRMRRFASDVLTARGIGLGFESSHSDDAITVNSNIRREVFLVFKEAVNNIVRHSGASRAEIEVGVENEALRVRIADDGCGLETAEAAGSGGNGIPSMRRRVTEMNGGFSIDSRAGHGTTIVYRIPLEAPTQTGGEPAGLRT